MGERRSETDVMQKALFTRAAEIYTPFAPSELRQLRRFVRQVDRLRSFSFFEHPPHRMKATLGPGGLVTDFRADSPSDEAICAVMTLFRELYNPNSATSGDQILKLLEGHARGRKSQHQAEAVADLKSMRRDLKWRRREDPRGKHLEEDSEGAMVARTPAEIINVWLNGEYFHFDEPKAAELLDDHPVTEFMKVTLLSAIHDFANLWGHARNAAFVALREPTLHAVGAPE